MSDCQTNSIDPYAWHVAPPGMRSRSLYPRDFGIDHGVKRITCGVCGGPGVYQHRRLSEFEWEVRRRSLKGWIYAKWVKRQPKPPPPPKPPEPVKEPACKPIGKRLILRPRKRPIAKPRPLEFCRGYGYIRYSKQERGDPNNDPQYQVKGIEEYYSKQANTPKWERFFQDNCSGYSYDLEDRPAGQQLLDILRPGDWLVIWHPYRLGRQMDDVMHNIRFFRRAGVVLKIVTIPSVDDFNSLMGDIVLFGMALGAQLQSESISQYTKAAIKRHKEMGRVWKPTGDRIPYKLGCRIEQRGLTHQGNPAYYAIPDDNVVAFYGHMAQLREQGYDWDTIAEAVNGVSTPDKRKYKPKHVKEAVLWFRENHGVDSSSRSA